jgi:hypothetical protein
MVSGGAKRTPEVKKVMPMAVEDIFESVLGFPVIHRNVGFMKKWLYAMAYARLIGERCKILGIILGAHLRMNRER